MECGDLSPVAWASERKRRQVAALHICPSSAHIRRQKLTRGPKGPHSDSTVSSASRGYSNGVMMGRLRLRELSCFFSEERKMLRQPFFVPAILILLLAIPLILGLIPRNRAYGVRASKTLTEDRVWYRANRYGGWALLLSSAIYLAVASALPSAVSGRNDFGRWLLHLCAFVFPLVISLLRIRSYVKRL